MENVIKYYKSIENISNITLDEFIRYLNELKELGMPGDVIINVSSDNQFNIYAEYDGRKNNINIYS